MPLNSCELVRNCGQGLPAHAREDATSLSGSTGDGARIRELVELSRAGDETAFEELVFLYREAVWRVAHGYTRETDAAVDIVPKSSSGSGGPWEPFPGDPASPSGSTG